MGCRWAVPKDRPAESRPVPDLSARAGVPAAPYRAVTVAELACRLNWAGRTALLRVVRPAEDALSVEELLRREGRWGDPPRTRHLAAPTPPRQPRRSGRPSSGTPIVAPPPLHFAVRPGLRRTIATDSSRHGLGPLGGRSPLQLSADRKSTRLNSS